MKIDWNNWDAGGKIIFVSSCVAALSLLLPWVDIGLVSRNGISQGAAFLVFFYAYPLINLLRSQSINKWLGTSLGVLSVLITISYISSKTLKLFGDAANVSGIGSHLFLIASITLIIGIAKYQKTIEPPL